MFTFPFVPINVKMIDAVMLHAQCIQQAHPQAISHKYYVGLECYQNESFFLESHNWCIPYQDNDVIAKVCSQSQPSTVHF